MPPTKTHHSHHPAPHLHCLRCKTKTPSMDFAPHVTGKGVRMVKSKCKSCGGKKSSIVKRGDGFFSDLFSGRLFTHPGRTLDDLSNGALEQPGVQEAIANAPMAAGAGIHTKTKRKSHKK